MMWLYIILAVIITNWLLDLTVEILNKKQSRKPLPPAVADIYDNEEYRRSQAYGRANTNISILSNAVNLILLVAAIIFGGFAILYI